ncbi:hypothetical protein [Streptomyces sp. NPDC091268]|uniref:hypothetical protein n=1 Tax=Streptomyces sp. NPDC091268 TaxID=3365979 RepID=UPI0038022230
MGSYAPSRGRRTPYEPTAFVPAATARIDAGVDVRRIMRDLDLVTLQGHDFHVSGERRTARRCGSRPTRARAGSTATRAGGARLAVRRQHPVDVRRPAGARAKTRYVREEGLGGAMLRSLDGDSTDGALMTAVDRGLRGR